MTGFQLQSTDPAYNLALEEALFDSLQAGQDWFMLWQNRPSIIVGRHQNTLEELNHDFITANDIQVVRRSTGGGAVYHDLGNLNFSFLITLKGKSAPGFAYFLEPIIRALHKLDLPAELSGRNDLLVDGRKVSGNALRVSGDKALCHGTLLVDTDFTVLEAALAGNPDKYMSKGIASHKSRVANLREYLPKSSGQDSLRAVAVAVLQSCAESLADLPDNLHQTALALAEKKYRSWHWNYGKSPEFTVRKRRRFAWGSVECLINVRQGLILDWRFYGDFFPLAEIEDLELALRNQPYTRAAIARVLAAVALPELFAEAEQEELAAFLSEI